MIKEGYATTYEAAVIFDEDDTGLEIIPFEKFEDAATFAAEIIDDGYGGAYGMDQGELLRKKSEIEDKVGDKFVGAVTHKQAQEALAKGAAVDTMWDYYDIVIRPGGHEGDKEE